MLKNRPQQRPLFKMARRAPAIVLAIAPLTIVLASSHGCAGTPTTQEDIQSQEQAITSADCPTGCVPNALGCYDPTTAQCGGALRNGTNAAVTTAAIQSAMNCAALHNPAGLSDLIGGGVVCLPQGRYLVNSTLYVRAPTIDGGLELSSNGLIVRGAGEGTTEITTQTSQTVFASDNPEGLRTYVGFEDFTIRFEYNGAAGIGIDMTGMTDSHVTRVGVGFNPRSGTATPYGIGIYARGQDAGAAPYNNRIDGFGYSSHHGVSPNLAYGIDFEPQNRTTSPGRGVNQNLILGGTIRGADVGIKITSGNANTIIGVNIEGATTVHYEFGDFNLACGDGGVCSVDNRVLGGSDEGGSGDGGPPTYYARFNTGSYTNTLESGHVTGMGQAGYNGQLGYIQWDNTMLSSADSGNRVLLGGYAMYSTFVTGMTAVPFLAFTALSPISHEVGTTAVNAVFPSTTRAVRVPDQSGAFSVTPP